MSSFFNSLTIFLLLPTFVFAYNPTINIVEVPYAVTAINSDIENKHEYLGELKNDPHMYEFVSGTTTDLTLSLIQYYSEPAVPFSIIVVKEKETKGGVQEVGRLNQKNIEWQTTFDKKLGLKLNVSSELRVKVTPGIYRIEVSTPENQGRYALLVGKNDQNHGYFTELSNIYTINTFLSDSFFTIFRSSYVYYPFGLIILAILSYLIWQRRLKVKQNLSNNAQDSI